MLYFQLPMYFCIGAALYLQPDFAKALFGLLGAVFVYGRVKRPF